MSVEGKFLSKEINDLFWREGLTLVTAESTEIGRRRRKKQKHCKCNPKCTATASKVVPKRRK